MGVQVLERGMVSWYEGISTGFHPITGVLNNIPTVSEAQAARSIFKDPAPPPKVNVEKDEEILPSKPLFGKDRGYDLRGDKHLLEI